MTALIEEREIVAPHHQHAVASDKRHVSLGSQYGHARALSLPCCGLHPRLCECPISGSPMPARKATGRDTSHRFPASGRTHAPRGQAGKDSFNNDIQLNSFNHGSVIR